MRKIRVLHEVSALLASHLDLREAWLKGAWIVCAALRFRHVLLSLLWGEQAWLYVFQWISQRVPPNPEPPASDQGLQTMRDSWQY